MDQSNNAMRQGAGPFGTWGFWALLAGAVALVLVFAQIGLPMTVEQKTSVATQIGEMAGEMKRAAWRSFLGMEREVAPVDAQPVPFALWIHPYIVLVAPVFGAASIVLAAIAASLHEDKRMPAYGATLGAAAIAFQFLWWVAALIAGIVLLIAIIRNLGSFFSPFDW